MTLITTYSAQFRGLYDRKRKPDFTSTRDVQLSAEAAVKALREAHTLKRGTLRVIEYANTEDLGGGLYRIPITQGREVSRETIG